LFIIRGPVISYIQNSNTLYQCPIRSADHLSYLSI
jgi:hypothetical protein